MTKPISDTEPLELGKDCEITFCNDKQTTQRGANYGMCDGHYMGSLRECERCLSDEGSWCPHKDKVEN